MMVLDYTSKKTLSTLLFWGIGMPLILVALIALVCDYKQTKDQLKYAEQLVFAYHHHYEASEFFLDPDGWDAPVDVFPQEVESLYAAERELDSLWDCHSLPFPKIIKEAHQQRDQLADAIRYYMEHHPESATEMYSTIEDFGTDLSMFSKWSYGY